MRLEYRVRARDSAWASSIDTVSPPGECADGKTAIQDTPKLTVRRVTGSGPEPGQALLPFTEEPRTESSLLSPSFCLGLGMSRPVRSESRGG